MRYRIRFKDAKVQDTIDLQLNNKSNIPKVLRTLGWEYPTLPHDVKLSRIPMS